MKVKGNLSPAQVSVERYLPKQGFAEVRIRNNIEPITVIDEETNEETKMFQYDEYVFLEQDRENLESDILQNFDEWVETGRQLEINENASIFVEQENLLTDLMLEKLMNEGAII